MSVVRRLAQRSVVFTAMPIVEIEIVTRPHETLEPQLAARLAGQ